MKTKAFVSLALAFAMLITMAGCSYYQIAPQTQGSAQPAQPGESNPPSQAEAEPAATGEEAVELIIFAAASMTETLTEIAEQYKDVAPNVSLVFNFDSSGTLKTQIEEGADVDVFISAAQKQMNQLDSSKDGEDNPDGLDFVLQGSRINLLENKVALAVPNGNPKDIESYDDLALGLKNGDVLLAMGNSDVPVGQYTQKIFAYYELDEEELAAYLEYMNKLTALRDEMHLALDNLPHKDIVTFHEAFPYFARAFGIEIAGVIEHEPGEEPGTREIAQTCDLVKELGIRALFVEPQYPQKAAETIARETGAGLYRLDPVVSGDSSKESYELIMRENARVLLEALAQ